MSSPNGSEDKKPSSSQNNQQESSEETRNDSNLQESKSSSIQDLKSNAKITSLNSKSNQSRNFRDLREHFDSPKSKDSRQTRLTKANAKQKGVTNIKRNFNPLHNYNARESKATSPWPVNRNNAREIKSTSPWPGNQNNTNELIDLMTQFSINASTNQLGPNQNMNRSSSRRFTLQPNLSAASQSNALPNAPIISQNYSNLTSTLARPMLTNLTLLAHNASIQMRIQAILEQLTFILEGIATMIDELREEISEIHQLEDQTRSTDLNAQSSAIIDAITNILPQRLSERFGQEIERSLSKFFTKRRK